MFAIHRHGSPVEWPGDRKNEFPSRKYAEGFLDGFLTLHAHQAGDRHAEIARDGWTIETLDSPTVGMLDPVIESPVIPTQEIAADALDPVIESPALDIVPKTIDTQAPCDVEPSNPTPSP